MFFNTYSLKYISMRRLNYLERLEQESIDIVRDVCASNKHDEITALYSLGKDSSVLVHILEKAFYPHKVPIKFLHIDTGWKFKEMYDFKREMSKKIDILTYMHPAKLNPSSGGSEYTSIMKTEALKNALKRYGCKIAFAGARRDEEKSRAKERILSIRDKGGSWDPRSQQPEMPPLFNTFLGNDQTLRVFPISNWTEVDVWRYIKQEDIKIVPIYFSHIRSVVEKEVNNSTKMLFSTESGDGKLIRIRFRTLGCYPLTGAIRSEASTIDQIIDEINKSEYSERITRAIDYETDGAMEIKKREGYF